MTLVLLLYQNLTKKKKGGGGKVYTSISIMNREFPPQKITGKMNPTAHTRIIHHNQVAFITKKARLTQHLKIN